MENASKALIIAGAILLSILIISLGIMVYNNAKNTVGSASLDKQEIQTFNSDFEKYVGDNKTASEVRTMISEVIASNASENNGVKARTITINGVAPTSVPATLSGSTSYIISVDTNASTGLITNINYKARGSQTNNTI